MKVVLDTNVFISSFFSPQGNPKKIIDLWKAEKIILCMSYEILWEYLEVLLRLGIESQEAKKLLNFLKTGYGTKFVEPVKDTSVIINDPDDNKFINTAISARARSIISGDKHLLDIKKYQDIEIITLANFLSQYF